MTMRTTILIYLDFGLQVTMIIILTIANRQYEIIVKMMTVIILAEG